MTTGGVAEWIAGLGPDHPLLDRTSAAERVAQLVREMITEGAVPPGERLSEEQLVAGLGVSRNTLREAFHLLGHERLLVHRLNRGVFVRKLTTQDVADIYRMRRLVECAAVRHATDAPEPALRTLSAALIEGERAARAGRWRDVGTANIQFHQAFAGLLSSPRIDEMMRQVLAELRLAYHVMQDSPAFYEPYLATNKRILDLIRRGDLAGAERELTDYLDGAERQLVAAYSGTKVQVFDSELS